MLNTRPFIAITMGDPTGIGPEITVKALSLEEIYAICRPVVIGDTNVMSQACKMVKVKLKVNSISNPKEGRYKCGTLDVLDMNNVDISKIVYKRVSIVGGKSSLDYIYKAIDLAMGKEVQAVVTGPIHKEAIRLAGCPYVGHTEIFAQRTHTKDYAMMMVEGNFRVVYVTTHLPLREACKFVKRDRVLKVIRLAHQAARFLGIKSPRIIVPGLNPHASDGGIFGDEEKNEILPAVMEAKRKGIYVDGPISPDIAFVRLKAGQYDVGLAMYHDQGCIPLKLMGFVWNKRYKKFVSVRGVNVTLGLPIIRTSVDHGVAYDIASEGEASPQSLIEAIKLAVKLCRAKC